MRSALSLTALAASMYVLVGVSALGPTDRLLLDACRPRLTAAQQPIAVLLWPISIWAASGVPSRC